MLVVAAWFAVWECRDAINKRQAFAVASELGARVGSISCWPFGDEIRIEIYGTQFSRADLHRLEAFNPLTSRHSVGILFVDTNITQDDIDELRRLLPHCVVNAVANGNER